MLTLSPIFQLSELGIEDIALANQLPVGCKAREAAALESDDDEEEEE